MKTLRTKNAPVAVPQDTSAAGASALPTNKEWLEEFEAIRKMSAQEFAAKYCHIKGDSIMHPRTVRSSTDAVVAMQYNLQKVFGDMFPNPTPEQLAARKAWFNKYNKDDDEQIFPNPHIDMDKEPQGLEDFQQLAYDYHMSKGNHPTVCMVPSATFNRIVREAMEKFKPDYAVDINDQRTMIGGCEIIRDYHMESGMIMTHTPSKL